MTIKKKKKLALPKQVRLSLRDWELLRRVAFKKHMPMATLISELIAGGL
jgi:hypothetical protein